MDGRVVHLTTVHQPRDNRILNKEARALAEAGVDVLLVARSESDDLDARVPLVALPKVQGPKRVILGQAKAWRTLSELKPVLVHIHDPELIPLAWLWARTHRASVIYDAHEDLVAQISTKSYLPRPLRPVARGLAKWLVGFADRRMDAIVAATGSVSRAFTNPRRIVVRNYPWLRDYPTEPGTPVPGRVVYAGDLSEERRLGFMLEVIGKARQSRPDAHLVLAGRVLHGARTRLKQAGAGDGSDPRAPVQYLGLLRPTQVPALIGTASVGLIFLQPLPNYVRSLPTKLFEYMGARVPFLASDFPFWREEFEEFQAGRFTDSEDVDAAAAALVELLDDDAGRATMGANGYRAIQSRFNFESQATGLVTLTQELLDAAR